jgi:hypothetical protein
MLFSALTPEPRPVRLSYLLSEHVNDREFTALLTAGVSPSCPHLEFLYQSAMLICRAYPELDSKENLSPAESSNGIACLLLFLSLRGLKALEKGGLAAGLRNAGRGETLGDLRSFELALH